jgi:hypothetical protein
VVGIGHDSTRATGDAGLLDLSAAEAERLGAPLGTIPA